MWQNLICPAGAELLRQAMRTNFTLLQVDAINAMAHAVLENICLQFQLEGNPVCDDDDPDAVKALQSINDYVYENEMLSHLWHGRAHYHFARNPFVFFTSISFCCYLLFRFKQFDVKLMTL